ncbi:MAG: response regulator, partial [Marinomonas sp.]
VVDDDPVVRGLLSDILVPLGFNVLEANDAQMCLEELESAAPDLFVLDVSMPGMDGLTLAKKLRDQGISAPIVMLSADAQENQREPDEQAAFDRYLVKPISNSVLLETIQYLLSLEWDYQEIDAIAFSEKPILSTESSLQNDEKTSTVANIPDHESVRELMAFAEMGYKKGVRGVLDQMDKSDVMALEHKQQLESLYQSFQFDGIVQYLKQHSL